MGGVARLACELGHTVSGSDQNTYPPMSTQLEQLGVRLSEGYSESNIPDDVDIVLVGNSISRTNPELEWVLDRGLRYTSGAQWLSENVLHERWVLAVAGTHGKTTTSSLLTWILEQCGYQPGFLIGGIPENFGVSARLGESVFFVIEADEYDTSFADKRSKFVHYHPKTLIINNLEFDHADIFNNLAEIQRQFHHVIKTVPAQGQIIYNAQQDAIDETLAMGCWSEQRSFTVNGEQTETDWSIEPEVSDGSHFRVIDKRAGQQYSCHWPLIGEHNLNNAVSAIAAAKHVGVSVADACQALSSFASVKRRLELKGDVGGIAVYDDFAHHPTAIKLTLQALRDKVGLNRIIAVIEPRSNTMKMGVHKDAFVDAVAAADLTLYYFPETLTWDSETLINENAMRFAQTDELLDFLAVQAKPNDHILMMSNGSFENLHNRLISRLNASADSQ